MPAAGLAPTRKLPEGEKYKLPKGFFKALELWNLARVKHCKHLIVVEGYFGAMRLRGLRLPAVALMGSSLSGRAGGAAAGLPSASLRHRHARRR